MSDETDRTTVGASETGQQVLKRLKDQGIFPEMMDAYRFAIGLGLAFGQRTPVVGRETLFNIGSFDKDHAVANLITTLMPSDAVAVYRAAEEYAETGFGAMSQAVEAGEFRFTEMLDLARAGRKVLA